MNIFHKIELQRPSSGSAMERAMSAVSEMCAVRDSAVAAVLNAAAAEYAADGRGWVLRRRFHDYVRRMPGLDPIARHIARTLALDAEVAASGALEASFTLVSLGEAVGHDRHTVRNHIVDPGGLKSRGLVEEIERARGGGQVWRLRLVIGAADCDLPAKAVESFVARVVATAGRASS